MPSGALILDAASRTIVDTSTFTSRVLGVIEINSGSPASGSFSVPRQGGQHIFAFATNSGGSHLYLSVDDGAGTVFWSMTNGYQPEPSYLYYGVY